MIELFRSSPRVIFLVFKWTPFEKKKKKTKTNKNKKRDFRRDFILTSNFVTSFDLKPTTPKDKNLKGG